MDTKDELIAILYIAGEIFVVRSEFSFNEKECEECGRNFSYPILKGELKIVCSSVRDLEKMRRDIVGLETVLMKKANQDMRECSICFEQNKKGSKIFIRKIGEIEEVVNKIRGTVFCKECRRMIMSSNCFLERGLYL